MPKIISVAAYPIALPLKEPFTTAKGQTSRSRTVIIKIRTDSGIVGLGEATPVRYVTGETIRSVVPSVAKARVLLLGTDPADWRHLGDHLEQALPEAYSARAGLEMALLDAAAREQSVPVYEFLGGNRSTAITDDTISVVPAEHAAELVREAWRRGMRRFKIKVDGGEDDVDRVLAVAEAAPEADIKVDANQAFTPRAAIEFIDDLEAAGVKLSLLEQPVAKEDIEGLKLVTENVSVPVFADEAALTPDSVRRLIDAGAVNGVNVKLMKSGVRGALEIVDICRQAGIKLMIGCMLESKIGLSAALHIASATQAFEHFDLDSDELIARQPVSGGFERDGDKLTIADGPGLGCALTAGRMEIAKSALMGFMLSRGDR